MIYILFMIYMILSIFTERTVASQVLIDLIRVDKELALTEPGQLDATAGSVNLELERCSQLFSGYPRPWKNNQRHTCKEPGLRTPNMESQEGENKLCIRTVQRPEHLPTRVRGRWRPFLLEWTDFRKYLRKRISIYRHWLYFSTQIAKQYATQWTLKATTPASQDLFDVKFEDFHLVAYVSTVRPSVHKKGIFFDIPTKV